MNIVYLGIDLAKNVFQLCGLNQAGKPVYSKRTGRKGFLQTVANIPALPDWCRSVHGGILLAA